MKLASNRLSACLKIYKACALAMDKGIHEPIIVEDAPRPSLCGARRTLGKPRRGKQGDYEFILPLCMRCHILVFDGGRLEVHVDRLSPLCDPIGHLVADASRFFTSLSTLAWLALLVLLGPVAASGLTAALAAYILGLADKLLL